MSESMTSLRYFFSSSPWRLPFGNGVRLAFGPPCSASVSETSKLMMSPYP